MFAIIGGRGKYRSNAEEVSTSNTSEFNGQEAISLISDLIIS